MKTESLVTLPATRVPPVKLASFFRFDASYSDASEAYCGAPINDTARQWEGVDSIPQSLSDEAVDAYPKRWVSLIVSQPK